MIPEKQREVKMLGFLIFLDGMMQNPPLFVILRSEATKNLEKILRPLSG